MCQQLIKYFPVLVLAVWSMAGVGLILRDPIEIGPDEGMEHAKALLVAVKPSLVDGEWNDQPWFYSFVFGILTQASLTCMRLATLGLFVVMAGWLAVVLGWRHGVVAAFVTVLSLISWAGVPGLALSAMCEVPAAALIMLAGAMLLCHERPRERFWLYGLAGVLCGAALAIKLTAVLLIPFVIGLLLTKQTEELISSYGHRFWRRLLPFGLFTFVTLTVCLLPGDTIQSQFLSAHWKAATIKEARLMAPGWGDFLPASGTCLFAIAGVMFLRNLPCKRLAVAALFAFFLVAAIHSFHRPFWWFYRVHFAFPLSVLAGIGAAACIPTDALRSEKSAFRMLFGLAACCLFITTNIPTAWTEMKGWWRVPPAADHAMLARIKALQKHPGYGFSYQNIMVSRANRLMVPSLTILSKKRNWSRDSNDQTVFAAVKQFRPVFLLLGANQIRSEHWRQWLAEDYVRSYSHGDQVLMVRKDLNPLPETMTLEQIRRLGL